MCGGRNARPLSHFSWSNLESLFRKQKRAVWLTARDNVKGMKTYTVTLAFLLSAYSVALGVTSRPQQQITGFQSVKPTLTDCKCVRYIDQAPHSQYANTRSLIYSSCGHFSANKLNANLWLTGSRETFWCDRTFGIWQKFTNHKLDETFKRWKPLWERAEWKQLLPWLASDINDMFNSPKANQKSWICLDLCTTSVIYLGQFPAESQRTFIWIKHTMFTALRSRCTNWQNHAALTYFLLLRLDHSLWMESNKRQSQN